MSGESPQLPPRDPAGDEDLLTVDEATQVMRALDALDELEAAALKLVRAELACGPVLDGLVADPLTEGTRLDLLCLADTLAVDLLDVLGRSDAVRRLVDEAPPGSARNALDEHLTRP
ncbi:MAG: hypothetical protein CL466_01270 [Acidimicrobiaceae bacterium]|nr:hypothetical protein [Acidimicrobiaceae bacterium]